MTAATKRQQPPPHRRVLVATPRLTDDPIDQTLGAVAAFLDGRSEGVLSIDKRGRTIAVSFEDANACNETEAEEEGEA